MTTQKLIELDKENVINTYSRFPVSIDHGNGAKLYDLEGKEYIDFTSGIGASSLGYGNEKWVDAISEQAKKLGHISNLFYTEPGVKVAKELRERTGMSGVFFANSGAESNEGIIKLARKYAFDKYGNSRPNIVTLINSFHGRTVTTLAATGQEVFHNFFFPFTEGFRFAKAGDIEDVKAAAGNDSCAIMMELIQGEGGVIPLEKSFVNEVMEFCRENDMLLLIDEVQTGVGRTGTLFAFQQYGILPDAVSFAKGIAGGLPFGGFMVNEKCKNILGAGSHATTFGMNPICSAASLAVLDTLNDDVLAEVRKKGDYIRSEIRKMESPLVADVRGLGLMIGVVIKGASHKELAMKLIENGLLSLTAGEDALRFLPPLTISYEEIDAGLAILKKVMEEY